MPDNFWRFPAYAKWDQLQDDGTDDYLLSPALKDQETGVMLNEKNSYTLYGDSEALLYRPVHTVTRIGMLLYYAVCVLTRKDHD